MQGLALNKSEVNLLVSYVWMDFILICVLYVCNLYSLSTPHVDVVVIQLQCILRFTADEVKL